MLIRSAIRFALLSLAAAFLVWELFGAARWISHAGGLGPAAEHFWTQVHGDWMLLVAVSDLLLIAAIALAVLWADAARRGLTFFGRVCLAVSFIALGSPVILCYLAWRLGDTALPGSPAPRPGGA